LNDELPQLSERISIGNASDSFTRTTARQRHQDNQYCGHFGLRVLHSHRRNGERSLRVMPEEDLDLHVVRIAAPQGLATLASGHDPTLVGGHRFNRITYCR
jgi:hypothetical protein